MLDLFFFFGSVRFYKRISRAEYSVDICWYEEERWFSGFGREEGGEGDAAEEGRGVWVREVGCGSTDAGCWGVGW